MEACQNPDILRVIFYIKEILNIIFIIVPIGLIVMIGIDFFKNVTAGKEDEMKKNLSIAIKRIIYCVCIFFVPTIVSLVNSILGDLGVNYVECMNGATLENIEDKINDQAASAVENAISSQNMSSVLEAETYVNKMKDGSQKEEYLNTLESIKQGIIDEEKQKQEEEEKQNQVKPSTGGSFGSSNDGNTQTEVLTDGIQGKYYAPVQQKGLYFYGGPPVHDLGASEGSKLYAGMDGTATFYQAYTTVNGTKKLYSYGNFITLTSSNGTKITYAHLQKFVNGINAPVTESLPYPCSASNYSGQSVPVGSLEVKKGQLIGYTGNTGNSSAEHLHVEITENGTKVSDLDRAFGYK